MADRWEPVARFDGTGNGRTGGFDIAAHAIEWRVTASCAAGSLAVMLPPEPEPLVRRDCAARAFGFSIRTGPATLDVAATGSWEVVVDQSAHGTVDLYRLADGRRALRFEPFQVTANTDPLVWLSAAEKPDTSKDAFVSDHAQIDALKATAGPQSYLVPDDVPRDLLESVVVWCEPVRTAYVAASLSFP